MCKYVVRELPYLLGCVPDQYKTQQICDKAIFENGETFKSIPVCYKIKMCDKAVNTYPHTLKFFSECYKTHKMCDKAVDNHPSPTKYVPAGIELKKCVIKQLIYIFCF